jgi:hypothetical protein
MSRRSLNRTHFVKFHLRATIRGLPSRLNPRKPATDDFDVFHAREFYDEVKENAISN